MITVCSEFEKRLEVNWYRLQRAIEKQVGHSLSQRDLDERAVQELELLAKWNERRYNERTAPVAAGVVCKCFTGEDGGFCPMHGRIQQR